LMQVSSRVWATASVEEARWISPWLYDSDPTPISFKPTCLRQGAVHAVLVAGRHLRLEIGEVRTY
jgi:hypothetical protein